METDSFTTRIIAVLQGYCDNYYGGNIKETSKALGLDADTGILYKWLRCKNLPRIDKVGPCLEKIGVEVIAPWERNQVSPENPTGIQQELSDTRAMLAEERARVTALQGEVRALERTIQHLVSPRQAQSADGKVMFQQTYNSKD